MNCHAPLPALRQRGGVDWATGRRVTCEQRELSWPEVAVQDQKSDYLLWIFPALLVPALILLIWGVVLMFADPARHTLLAAGVGLVVVVLGLWLHALSVRGAVASLQRDANASAREVDQRLSNLTALLHQISEQQLISERAKAIAFREREREALRRAIREEIARRDWDAASRLADDIESMFGYRQEAERFRQEIQVQRDAEAQRQIAEAIALIDKHCRSEDWSAAVREADRIHRLYPADPAVQRLAQDVEARRVARKQQLLTEWNQAVQRHDIEGSIEVLRSLDRYLTPQEAASMQETARQVFKDKLMLLGQQFTLAVKEHAWREALRLGQTIVAQFPNSRMAQEVQEKMALLETRAAEEEPAAV